MSWKDNMPSVKPSIPVGRPLQSAIPNPQSAMVVAPRNLSMEEDSIFQPDTVQYEYDTLSAAEKAELEFFRRHDQHEHEARAHAALDSYQQSSDVDALDYAIALLLHLRETAHPDE